MWCPFCVRAKQLLKSKDVPFQDIDVSFDRLTRTSMTQRSGGATSVPQIFFDDKLIGGCDELYALEAKGELDALLGKTE